MYSETPLNGHPSTADTYTITHSCKNPKCFSIDFNILETPEQWTPYYYVSQALFCFITYGV